MYSNPVQLSVYFDLNKGRVFEEGVYITYLCVTFYISEGLYEFLWLTLIDCIWRNKCTAVHMNALAKLCIFFQCALIVEALLVEMLKLLDTNVMTTLAELLHWVWNSNILPTVCNDPWFNNQFSEVL